MTEAGAHGDATDRYLDRLRREPPPPLTRDGLAAARRAFDEAMRRLHPVPAIDLDVRAEHPAGCPPLRLYRGATPDCAILFFHGGGFVMGSLDSHDALCRALAAATRALVVSVAYRLAPEHPFPAARDDARAAMNWLRRNLGTLGIPEGRIAVMGDSAGGGLAAGLAADAPTPFLQILLYPALDLTASSPSHRAFAAGFGLDAATIDFCYRAYVPDAERRGAEASPVSRADLAAAAPALLVLGDLDPLRDEGLAYADSLRAAGVPVTVLRYPRMVHGFVTMPRLFPEACEALAEIAALVPRAPSQTRRRADPADNTTTRETRRSRSCPGPA